MQLVIHIKTLTGESFTLTVDSEETVKEIKRRVYGDQWDQIRLIYAGKQLEDEHTLDSYNIPNESILHLIKRLKSMSTKTVWFPTFLKISSFMFSRRKKHIHVWSDMREFYKRRYEIFVKDEIGRTISVCVDSEEEMKNMTVKEFRRRIIPEDEEHDEWRLVYLNKQLDHGQTLGYYGISNGCTILKTLVLRGGGGPPPDEDKGVPRTGSMEKLANMQQEESRGSCCIM